MNNNDLRKLQLCELDILKEFIRICKELKLDYFLCGGTLLGAIRHDGFIPWDDDIDVYMFRKDYDIFLKEAPKLMKKNFFLQTIDTDPNYLSGFAKVRNSDTTFIETTVKNFDINHGVYMDIFPMDSYNTNKKLKNFFINMKRNLIKLQFRKKYYCENDKNRGLIFLLKLKSSIFISNVFYGTMSLKKLSNKLKKMCSSCKNGEYLVTYYDINKKLNVFKKEWIYPLSEHKFEDLLVLIPQNYDAMLKKNYGDYMQLPPEGERKNHHYTEIIDLENSYIKYKGKKYLIEENNDRK